MITSNKFKKKNSVANYFERSFAKFTFESLLCNIFFLCSLALSMLQKLFPTTFRNISKVLAIDMKKIILKYFSLRIDKGSILLFFWTGLAPELGNAFHLRNKWCQLSKNSLTCSGQTEVLFPRKLKSFSKRLDIFITKAKVTLRMKCFLETNW